MLPEETLLRVLRYFRDHVNALATLAVELDPDNRDVAELRRHVLAALQTNDLDALKLAGERLQPHQKRIYDHDGKLLRTLEEEAEGSDWLIPLITQFQREWGSFKQKRRDRIFRNIQGVLEAYMVVYGGVRPEDVGL